jgi:ribose-phosphate pyrophosphokinase
MGKNMIKIKDLQTDKFINFELTKFPDGTSQIWKLSPPPDSLSAIEVIWMFENEAEFFHVCQLGYLLVDEFKCFPVLTVPFLPFGRQDKKVGNNSTFARLPFLDLLKYSGYSRVNTFDSHSSHQFINSVSIKPFHDEVISPIDLICFPDLGATTRYKHLQVRPHIWFQKVRNQQTGEIQGMVLEGHPDMIKGHTVTIVDDICDGGATFIGVAKELQKFGPKEINLVVTHGIFSKGTTVLSQAGIKNVYTTNSLLKNNYGYKVIELGE